MISQVKLASISARNSPQMISVCLPSMPYSVYSTCLLCLLYSPWMISICLPSTTPTGRCTNNSWNSSKVSWSYLAQTWVQIVRLRQCRIVRCACWCRYTTNCSARSHGTQANHRRVTGAPDQWSTSCGRQATRGASEKYALTPANG